LGIVVEQDVAADSQLYKWLLTVSMSCSILLRYITLAGVIVLEPSLDMLSA
jgi:hypothetical protein